MFSSIYDRFNEKELEAYHQGRDDALRFQANHGEITQELFKAETDDHLVFIGFDDVEHGVYLRVTFKRRFDKAGYVRTVYAGCGRFDSAMMRALDFLARHPHHRPYCSVDY